MIAEVETTKIKIKSATEMKSDFALTSTINASPSRNSRIKPIYRLEEPIRGL